MLSALRVINMTVKGFNPLVAKLFNWILTPLKLCLADAIHNIKWVKIIQIWQNGGQQISNLADYCHFLSLTGLKADIIVLIKNVKNEYGRHRRLKG